MAKIKIDNTIEGIKERLSLFKKMSNYYKKEIDFYKNTLKPNIEQININVGCYKKLIEEIKLLEKNYNNQV